MRRRLVGVPFFPSYFLSFLFLKRDCAANWRTTTDRPFTDLYETEGDGGFPGIWFMARPVVGGHFAPLALERACGGKAVEALRFLDEALRFLDEAPPAEVNVELALLADLSEGMALGGER